MKQRPSFDTLDLAWGIFVSKKLPCPASSRLLARADVPSDALGFFLDFYKIPKTASVRKVYANLDHPAHVTITPPNYTMRINSIYQGWHDAESSIISHELIHVLMSEMSIEGRTTWEDEIFTDAFAVFLGAPLIANFHVSVDFYKDSSMVKKMGYLDFKERSYALARFVVESGMSPPSRPSGAWRSADLNGLEGSIDILTRRKKTTKIRKNLESGFVCPRCQAVIQEPLPNSRNALLFCEECGMGWEKGFWGYKCTVC